jgi:hypothetical protein
MALVSRRGYSLNEEPPARRAEGKCHEPRAPACPAARSAATAAVQRDGGGKNRWAKSGHYRCLGDPRRRIRGYTARVRAATPGTRGSGTDPPSP